MIVIFTLNEKLKRNNRSLFHFDNHIGKKTKKIRFCDSCILYIRKLDEVHELTPTHKKQLNETFS